MYDPDLNLGVLFQAPPPPQSTEPLADQGTFELTRLFYCTDSVVVPAGAVAGGVIGAVIVVVIVIIVVYIVIKKRKNKKEDAKLTRVATTMEAERASRVVSSSPSSADSADRPSGKRWKESDRKTLELKNT